MAFGKKKKSIHFFRIVKNFTRLFNWYFGWFLWEKIKILSKWLYVQDNFIIWTVQFTEHLRIPLDGINLLRPFMVVLIFLFLFFFLNQESPYYLGSIIVQNAFQVCECLYIYSRNLFWRKWTFNVSFNLMATIFEFRKLNTFEIGFSKSLNVHYGGKSFPIRKQQSHES